MSNNELVRLSSLIGLIYEGATDPSRWTKDILPAISAYMEMPGCMLFTTLHSPQAGGYVFVHGFDSATADVYINKYQQEDVWIQAALKKSGFPEGKVVIGDELVPRQHLIESKFYKEFLSKRPHTGQMIAGNIFGLDSASSMPAAFSLTRGLDARTLGEDDRNKMLLILPHISRSLGVMQRIRTAELTVATTLSALDRLAGGILLLDHAGSLAFANRAAERMLEAGNGLRLRKLVDSPGFGSLVADTPGGSEAIAEAISASIRRDPYGTPHFSKCVRVPQTSGLACYTLQFSALGEHNEFGAFAAIVFIADSAQMLQIDPLVLQSTYGLTPAEAKVAIAFIEYGSAKEVAEALVTSVNTVRTQIGAVYSKLGVDSRARFMKVMLGLAPQELKQTRDGA